MVRSFDSPNVNELNLEVVRQSVDVLFDKLSRRWVTLVNMTGVCNSASY